jgi:hypothetical protein
MGVYTHPVTGEQLSLVHTLWSSQVTFVASQKPVPVLHAYCVQGVFWGHDTGKLKQVTLQKSLVQGLASLQSLFNVQPDPRANARRDMRALFFERRKRSFARGERPLFPRLSGSNAASFVLRAPEFSERSLDGDRSSGR